VIVSVDATFFQSAARLAARLAASLLHRWLLVVETASFLLAHRQAAAELAAGRG
jgi:hypothetical protein